MDEVGSQLEGLDLGRAGGRQLVPGLLYIENENGQQTQKQTTYKVSPILVQLHHITHLI